MRKQNFYPGQICLFDRYNFSNMKGKNSIKTVSIIRPYKKHLIKYDEWMVFIPSTQEVIIVPENFLCPAPNPNQLREIESIIMIRNPVNLPEITESDISNIKDSINIFENYIKILPPTEDNQKIIESVSYVNDLINGLNKLLIKFKFYSKMIIKEKLVNLGRINVNTFLPNMGDNNIINDEYNEEEDEYDEDDI